MGSIHLAEHLKSCLNSRSYSSNCPFQTIFSFKITKMGFEPQRNPKKEILAFSIIQLVCCALALITETIGLILGDIAFFGAGIWTGICFGICGGTGITAALRPSNCSIIAYMVLNIISSIFGALLVAFGIAGELILTGNWKNFTDYYQDYYISYFQSSFTNEHWYTIGCADGSGGSDCCTSSYPCGAGGGDCDSDVHCAGDLKCGYDNCNTFFGFTSSYDCCYDPSPDPSNSISRSICPIGVADVSGLCQPNVDYLILGFALSAMQILIGLMEFAISIAAAYSCRVFCSANDHVGTVHPKSVHPGAVHPGAIGYQNPGAVMVSPGTVANQYSKIAAPEMAAPEMTAPEMDAPEMAAPGMAAPEMAARKLDELQIQQIEEV